MKKIINNRNNIYVNLILQNEELYRPDEVPVFIAEKDYNLDMPIVEKASDYYLRIDSMTCSLTNIPIFIPDILPNIAPWFNTDVNKTIYSFTMEYNGTYSDQTYVNFISQSPNGFVKPLSPFQDRQTNYYDVFTYTLIIEMFNQALVDCFTNLTGKIALPTTDIPYFYFDNSLYIFCLVANKNFYDSSLLLPINIYCNYQLYEIINSMPFTYLANADGILPAQGVAFQLFIGDQGNNSISYPNIIDPAGDYYVMKQNNSSIASFFPLKSMYISTNNIPIGPQISPLKPNEENRNPNKVNKVKILLDLEPIIISTLLAGRNYIQYRPQIEEYIDLLSDNPINSLDASFYWRDRFGYPHIVYLNYNQPANIRISFINKKLVEKL